MIHRTVSLALLMTVVACSAASNPASSSGGSSGGSGDGGAGGSSSGSSGSSGGTSGDGGSSGSSSGGVHSSCAPTDVLLSPARSAPALHGGGYLKNLAVADLNKDGKVDVVVLEGKGVEVFLSNGDGTFGAGLFVDDSVGNGDGLAVGDFDGDGNVDVLVSSFGAASVDNSVDLLPGKGDGKLGLPKNSPISSTNIFAMSAADFNGDGKLDFAYQGQEGSGIVLNGGGADFGAPNAQISLGDGWSVGDLNGDRAADLVLRDAKGVCVRLNNGTGAQFADPVCYPSVADGASYTALGDINADGKLDILAAYDGHGGSSDRPNISVNVNKGDGTFQDRTLTQLAKAYGGVALVDVNNDGRADFLGYESYNSAAIHVLLAAADGTLTTTPLDYPIGGQSGSAVTPFAVGDFAGNGLRGFAAYDPTKGAVAVITATCKK